MQCILYSYPVTWHCLNWISQPPAVHPFNCKCTVFIGKETGELVCCRARYWVTKVPPPPANGAAIPLQRRQRIRREMCCQARYWVIKVHPTTRMHNSGSLDLSKPFDHLTWLWSAWWKKSKLPPRSQGFWYLIFVIFWHLHHLQLKILHQKQIWGEGC